MSYTVHDLKQGTPEWHAHRRNFRNASELSAAEGSSQYKSRSDAVKEAATGIAKEVTPELQALFDSGHAAEATARPWAEEIIGAELRPIVASAVIDGIPLSASYDGVTDNRTITWEHKRLNKRLATALDQGIVPDDYKGQLEQGMLIIGATRCLFMASDGDLATMRSVWYHSDPVLQARVVQTWKQFDADVASYVHVETPVAAVAAPVIGLPALSIQVNGSISLIDNLGLFGEKLKEFISGIDREPKDDQAFVDCEQAVKVLEKAEDALTAAESNALAQTASIDEMRRTVGMYRELARSTRLMLEKLVKAKKDSLRAEIVTEGATAFRSHIDSLNKRLGKPFMPFVPADFAGAAKNKRTIASLRDAVSTELARAKIAANEIADRIQLNVELARDAGFEFLFADMPAIVTKPADDFAMLVKSRIDAHKAAELAKEEATRERIRKEEAARLEEAERKRLAQVEAVRIADEESARKAEASRIALQAAQAQPAPQAAPVQTVGLAVPVQHVATVATLPARQRPTGAQLVEAVALHFRVSAATAADWLATTPATDYAGWPKSA